MDTQRGVEIFWFDSIRRAWFGKHQTFQKLSRVTKESTSVPGFSEFRIRG